MREKIGYFRSELREWVKPLELAKSALKRINLRQLINSSGVLGKVILF